MAGGTLDFRALSGHFSTGWTDELQLVAISQVKEKLVYKFRLVCLLIQDRIPVQGV